MVSAAKEQRLDKNPLVLLELVERLGNLMRTELRKSGGDEALQPVHLQALIYLSKANRYSNTPQALAEYLGLTKGTVSQTLLLLDPRGLRFIEKPLSPGRTPPAPSAPTASATPFRRCARR